MSNLNYWQYKQAQDLQIGDTVISFVNGHINEVTISEILNKKGNRVRFNRLNVEEIDNYFAGSVCIHNSEGEKYCNKPDPKDTMNKEAIKACGGNPPPPKGCQFTQGDKDAQAAAEQKICDGKKGKPVNPFTKGWVEDAIKDEMKANGQNPDECLSEESLSNLADAVIDQECPPPPPGPPDPCVRDDTLIATPNGLREVRHLKIGDRVLNYNIQGMIDSNDPTWSLWHQEGDLVANVSESVVVSNKHGYYHSWYQILLSNGQELNITYEHPVLVKTSGLPSLIS